MKLGIVIPLKSRRVSHDWEAVSLCLQATLKSLDNQSSKHWSAVVIGHEKPDIDWNSLPNKISWVQSTHDLPSVHEGGNYTNYKDFDRILDKNRKIRIGMHHLQSNGVTDWFVLDADDLVHRDFVKTLAELPSQVGWLVASGFLWYQDVKRWMPTNHLLHLCGSTAVINSSLFEVPSTDRDADLQQIPWCRMSHSNIGDFLTTHLAGNDPKFPLAGIAYTLSHGDNCSDEFRTSFKARMKLLIKKRFLTRPFNRDFAEMFGMDVK